MTLEEFLRERIAEDEAVAREVEEKTRRTGRGLPDYYEHATTSAAEIIWDVDYGQGGYTITAARVLAECEAKLRILELHESWPVLVETPLRTEFNVETFAARAAQQIAWQTTQEYRKRFGDEPPTSPILRAMALPYADHPDYREEWRP